MEQFNLDSMNINKQSRCQWPMQTEQTRHPLRAVRAKTLLVALVCARLRYQCTRRFGLQVHHLLKLCISWEFRFKPLCCNQIPSSTHFPSSQSGHSLFAKLISWWKVVPSKIAFYVFPEVLDSVTTWSAMAVIKFEMDDGILEWDVGKLRIPASIGVKSTIFLS